MESGEELMEAVRTCQIETPTLHLFTPLDADPFFLLLTHHAGLL